MDKFKYKVLSKERPLSVDELNVLGEKGWELCGALQSVGSYNWIHEYIYNFKQKIE